MTKYEWKAVGQRLLEKYGSALFSGEYVLIEEDEAAEILGASITNAMPGSCYLERGTSPQHITATIPKHLGILGFSSRLGTRHGGKYLVVYLPGESSERRLLSAGDTKRTRRDPSYSQAIHRSTLQLEIMTWLRERCHLPAADQISLFRTIPDGLKVDVHVHEPSPRRLLSRTKAMEIMYGQLIRKVVKNDSFDGIIYFMYLTSTVFLSTTFGESP